MKRERLQTLLAQFANGRVAVCGDFFLDTYLEIDPGLNEPSIETGKTAYQVVGKRNQPGAGGTVCNNLAALGIGEIRAITVLGDDGEGYELKKALQQRHVRVDSLIADPARFTPTYTKPMLRGPEGEEELNRLDTKNRSPLPPACEDRICQTLEGMVAAVDAVIIADQVSERNCGVITDNLCRFLAQLGQRYPDKLLFVDSRERIGQFRNVTLKPNRYEAVGNVTGEPSTREAILKAQQLHGQTGKTVFLTLDREGICPITDMSPQPVPCPPVSPQEKLDIVGAGDSSTAAIVAALVSGATPTEAAVVGNLVASLTIRQIGTTGEATPQLVLEAWDRYARLYESI
jgi:rfaE bifunctional protein kinase chain/domain